MNFNEKKSELKRRTLLLVLLFITATIGIIVAIDFIYLIMLINMDNQAGRAYALHHTFFEPIFIRNISIINVIILILVGGGSLKKIIDIKRFGGSLIADQLGATQVNANVKDPALRTLRNIVTEMAIASSVRCPKIYIMQDQPAINAFVAGNTPKDAALIITAGALAHLNRDELQGVIAHEFSHLLNGDMQLNTFTTGLLFGMVIIFLLGQHFLSNPKKTPVTLITGFMLIMIGIVGLYINNLIKLAINRERETLADHSAVRFTRQPNGIINALKKIAALDCGSIILHPSVTEIDHMLFIQFNFLKSSDDTHPPIFSRIAALDNKFKPKEIADLRELWRLNPPRGIAENQNSMEPDQNMNVEDAKKNIIATPSSRHRMTTTFTTVENAYTDLSKIFMNPIVAAKTETNPASLESYVVPPKILAAAKNNASVIPLLTALVYSYDSDMRSKQFFAFSKLYNSKAMELSKSIYSQIQILPLHLYIPLTISSLPALTAHSPETLKAFHNMIINHFITDEKLGLYEYCYLCVIEAGIRDASYGANSSPLNTLHLKEAETEAALLIATTSKVCSPLDADLAERIYRAWLPKLLPGCQAPYQHNTHFKNALDPAWPILERLTPQDKKAIIDILTLIICKDNEITTHEANFLRTVCIALHYPAPDILNII